MPELIKVKMNGVIPSVPITTLAGIASLTDLLPEMPLPTPLPQTLSNHKSLLFHARVAEEAKLQLNNRDETLIPQLIQALAQTSSDNIELKDSQYTQSTDQQPVDKVEQNAPELLKALLEVNPHVFKGPQYNSTRNWPLSTPVMHANQSPASYGRFSPSYSNSSSGSTRQTPQGSPAHPAAARTVLPVPSSTTSSSNIGHLQHSRMITPMTSQNHVDVTSQMSPFAVPSPSSSRATVITEQTRPSMTTQSHLQDDDVNGINSMSNVNSHANTYSPAHMGSSNAITHVQHVTNQQQHQQQQQQHHQQHQHHNLSSGIMSQHNMHITTSSMHTDMHSTQQQISINMNMNMHQNMYVDSIMNPQIPHQISSGTPMDLGSSTVAADNSQFLLDSVSGLSDIDLPIEGIDPKVEISDHQFQGTLMQSTQPPVYATLNPEAVANEFDPTISMPMNHDQHLQQHQQQQHSFQSHLHHPPHHQHQHQHQHHQQHQQQQQQPPQQKIHQHQDLRHQMLHEQLPIQQPPLQEHHTIINNEPVIKDIRLSGQSGIEYQKFKEPVVMLNRLPLLDQSLIQQNFSRNIDKSPRRAAAAAATAALIGKVNVNTKNLENSDSENDEDDEQAINKHFKSRGKDRLRGRRKKRRFVNDDEDYDEGNDNDGADDDGDYEDEEESKRKKRGEESLIPIKPKIRKIEKKLVPVLAKLSVDELMETNTYQLFNSMLDTIFDNTEDVLTATTCDAFVDDESNNAVPPELLIPKNQLQALCKEAAKLKSLRAMESVPPDRLVRLLNILEKNIRDGARVSPLADPDDDIEESKRWMQLAMEKVVRAVDASVIALNIMTSQNMPKIVYIEEVIDRIVLFMKFQLQNTIYPSFDPVYRLSSSKNKTENYNSSIYQRKKRSGAAPKEVREKSILEVYNKMRELVALLAELLNIQVLTDTSVLHASTLGVAPFFVESVNDLQLSALKLVTVIFTKYEKHRRLLLDDILASIARLPSSKRSLRTYRLNSGDYIQMLTALVLQLIQCVVTLPDNLLTRQDKNTLHMYKNEDDNNEDMMKMKKDDKKQVNDVDADILIINKYDTATRLAGSFLSVFLNKCSNKGAAEVDYRPLFENFVQDLLATVNKPEWPAAELLLSLLGNLLVGHFSNKNSDMSLRVASIEYLGVVAARLRKDAVNSQCKLSTIDQIVKDIKAEQQKDVDFDQLKQVSGLNDNNDDDRTKFLQKVLLDHLAVNGTNDPSLAYARHFYLAQWYRDCAHEKSRVGQLKNKNVPQVKKSYNRRKSKKRRNKHHGSDHEIDSNDDDGGDVEDGIDEVGEEDESKNSDENDNNERKNLEIYRKIEEKKKFILSSIRPYSSDITKPDILQTYIDYTSAELISQYLASKRPFSQSFDKYLKQILHVLTEPSIAIRTKAMKCLTMIVEADSSVLARVDMQLGVNHSFLDHSTSVREAAVDLVGKFVLSRPELIDKYYDMLLTRILDTGVSVRKRVIKILKDICIECPNYPKIPEICGKMIRRVNDEEGIRKLVMEVFQNMWFTPVRETPSFDSAALLRKVQNITDVVAATNKDGLEWFEQLLVSLFKPKEDKEDSTKVQTEPPKALLLACQQIVDCLIQHILQLECMPNHHHQSPLSPSLDTSNKLNSGETKKGSSQKLVACMMTLYLFAKIRPQLLVEHASTLQPYLGLKCHTQGDYQIISSVAHTLELVVPLMQHPSETFLAQLEEDSMKLIILHDKSVVASCLSCLGSIVNNVTKNYSLIRDCLNKYYKYLVEYKLYYEKDPTNPQLQKSRPQFRRALFTVGLLMRHFNFIDPEVIGDSLPANIKDQVFETFYYFMQQECTDVRYHTLVAIGSLCIRHSEFMTMPELKELYHYLLTSDLASESMKIQVLNNIELYLREEEKRMIKQDLEWAKMSKQENLKEMGDISSGMASTVIQVYLKEISESFIHANAKVRHVACKVIQLILAQGLVYPIQLVPYLICMSTDVEKVVSHTADNQLQEIERKYPGFIHMRSQLGIKLSYRLQKILQNDTMVRGMKLKEGEMQPSALNGFLYTILRNTKQQRRAIAISFLKQFEESAKSTLSQMLFLADNLAYFTYQVQDEPLFIIHHIDIIISTSGVNLLQSFKEALLPRVQPSEYYQNNQLTNNQELQSTAHHQMLPTAYPLGNNPTLHDEDDEDDDDEDAILARLAADTTLIREYITASQGFLLLLTLRQHLKEIYGFADAKINQYSPSESAKVYEKALTRKSNAHFNPKTTIAKLKEGETSSLNNQELDESGRRKLVAEYLDFKQLMLKLDPKEPDEDNDEKCDVKNSVDKQSTTVVPQKTIGNYEVHQNQKIQSTIPNINTDVNCLSMYQQQNINPVQTNNAVNVVPQPTSMPTTPKVPKLTIHTHSDKTVNKEHHRKYRTHKTEKVKKHKKKKRRRISDSSDSDDDDCSDPDYMV